MIVSLQTEVIVKIEELKIATDKIIEDDPALEKQNSVAVPNGHDEEITVAS